MVHTRLCIPLHAAAAVLPARSASCQTFHFPHKCADCFSKHDYLCHSTRCRNYALHGACRPKRSVHPLLGVLGLSNRRQLFLFFFFLGEVGKKSVPLSGLLSHENGPSWCTVITEFGPRRNRKSHQDKAKRISLILSKLPRKAPSL